MVDNRPAAVLFDDDAIMFFAFDRCRTLSIAVCLSIYILADGQWDDSCMPVI